MTLVVNQSSLAEVDPDTKHLHKLGDLSELSVWVFGLLACMLFAWSSFPTVEGWGLLPEWKAKGISAYGTLFLFFPDRPLHVLPSMLAGLIPGPFGSGAVVVGFVLAVSRLLIGLLMAKTLGISGSGKLLFLAAVVAQPLWPGSGYERFHAAQVSYSLTLLGLLLCFAPPDGVVWWRIAGAGFSMFVGFIFYQGLFVVCAWAPLAFWVLGHREIARRLAPACWISCISYVIYYLLIKFLFVHFYTQNIHESSLNWQIFERLAMVGFNAKLNSHIAAGAVAVFATYCFANSQWRDRIAFACCFALCPMTGIIFYNSPHNFNDPEHVMYSGTAWLVVVLAAASRCFAAIPCAMPPRLAYGTAVIFFCCGMFFPIKGIGNVQTQLAVLSALANSGINWSVDSDVLVIDETGELGHPYTFVHPYLGVAMKAYGMSGNATICTERPIAFAGTPSCRDCAVKAYTDVVRLSRESRLGWPVRGWIARKELKPLPVIANIETDSLTSNICRETPIP